MADPMGVVREMMRVVRPGGYAIAFEADFAIDLSYPACAALGSINKIWQGLFQSPAAGRKLVHYFRDAGATDIKGGAVMHLEHDAVTLKRTYRLTAEATGGAAEAKGVLTADEVREMVAGLAHMEADPSSVLIKFPDMWVIAKGSVLRTFGWRLERSILRDLIVTDARSPRLERHRPGAISSLRTRDRPW
jgi:hypothetical protein